MTKPGYTGLVRIAKAARYSIRGFRSAWRYESAFRQECTIAVILVPCAFLLAETFTQAGVLIAAIGLVLVAELLNSAIEAVVDRIGHEHHQLAGQAKDMGSAAVLVSLLIVLVTWSLVAMDRLV